MAVYADYAFYTAQFFGTAIAETDFAQLALRASAVIDALTLDQAAPVVTAGTNTATIDKIKRATCAVAEQLAKQEQGGEIASESVGGHSVSYVTSKRSGETWLVNTAKTYLWNTGLMYGGPE